MYDLLLHGMLVNLRLLDQQNYVTLRLGKALVGNAGACFPGEKLNYGKECHTLKPVAHHA
jgi:hypothetical protein